MTEFALHLKNEEETQKLGAILSNFVRIGDCFALFGDLGAGKTTFSRGFIQAILQTNEEIPSPTFTIVQTYEIDDETLYHFDLYRLENEEEIWELGWEEIGDGISLIEWPERAKKYLPKNRVELNIKFNAASRIANISIFGNGEFIEYWQDKFGKIANDFI